MKINAKFNGLNLINNWVKVMKVRAGVTKEMVIFLWCFCISLFLYYFSISISINPNFSFIQYVNFVILLFGSGLAYHVTTELFICPQTKDNNGLWKQILMILFKAIVGYAIIGCSLFLAMKFGGDWGWLLAFLGLVMWFSWVMYCLSALPTSIQKLVNQE